MNISLHISLKEAITSQEAIRHGIDNTPNEIQIEAMKLIADKVFEPLRTYISTKRGKDSPIKINSFFRSKAVNEAIGGSATSQHCKGEAIDIECNYPDFNNKDLFLALKDKSTYDQLIIEFVDAFRMPQWIHVSYTKSNNRKQILIATRKDGQTKYLPFSPELYNEIYG